MKFLSFFLFALFVSSSLIAQKQASILFRVLNGAGKKVAYDHHIEGKHWPAFPKEDSLNARGELLLPNDQTVAGYYSFIYKNKPYKKYFTKDPLREYWMAVSLDNYLLESRFQEFIPGFYNEFVKQYPRSRYTKYLPAGVENVKLFFAASKKEFNASQQFVQDADSISTVEELLTRFKGKTIYIDLWATWCGPCKAQFAFKNELDPFLKSKGVEVLYISLDRPGEDEKWKNMIRFYNLEGHHIRASWKLTNDIYQVFNSGMDKLARGWGLSIPRYAICKDGKIIIDKALQPGDKEELYKQIESVL